MCILCPRRYAEPVVPNYKVSVLTSIWSKIYWLLDCVAEPKPLPFSVGAKTRTVSMERGGGGVPSSFVDATIKLPRFYFLMSFYLKQI